MPRPKKSDEAKKDNRLTVYLTDQEQSALKDASEVQNRPMTQIVTTAVHDWLMRLVEPPESMRKARYERIMNEQSLTVTGYTCPQGHVWWIDWAEPMDPRCCPMCGTERELKRIWGGTVKHGL